MTALAGLWRLDGNPDAAAACDRMLAAQRIYGPDDGARWSDGPVALGRRLARLLPEDAYDRQPLHSADGHAVLVADVRLDNRDELCAALNLPAEQAGR
jgi:asparagine synthase (glutamine-hydrolysing)